MLRSLPSILPALMGRDGSTLRAARQLTVLTRPTLLAVLVALIVSAAAPTESAEAAPNVPDRKVSVIASFGGFEPSRIDADLGEELEVELTVIALSGAYDIVFELDGGRVVRTPAIGLGRTESIEFTAPAEAGAYPYYSSIDGAREAGYDGVLVVGGGAPTVVDAENFSYAPDVLRADPGEWVHIILNNVMGTHDIVFELDGGRAPATSRIMEGEQEELLFRAPEAEGVYPYFCSVGRHRDFGMEGSLIVGDATPAPTEPVEPTPDTTPVPTDPPDPTAVPTDPPAPPAPEYEVVIDELANPHGLHLLPSGRVLVSEGGTGEAVPGAFNPGNGDGRVLDISLADTTERNALISDMTNSIDPGGGIVGANHAISLTVPSGASGTASITLVAQAGGPGHLRPDDAAKILKLVPGEDPVVLADTLAYETANNPDGAEGPEGIDSNPWRLVPGPAGDDSVYIVDAGANDILKMNPETGELSTYAIFEPLDEDGAQQAIPTGIAFAGGGIPGFGLGAVVTLLGGFAPPGSPGYTPGQLRLLFDENGDGDVLDDGENELLKGDAYLPTDVVAGEDLGIFFSEMGRARVVEINQETLLNALICTFVGDPLSECFEEAGDPWAGIANGVPAVTGIALEADGSVLATTTGSPVEGANVNPDRVVRLAPGDFGPDVPVPTPVPTDPPIDPTSTPEPTEPPTTGPPTIYMPLLMRSF